MEHAHAQTEVCTLLATMSINAVPLLAMVGYLARATSQMSPWIISRVLWSNATLLLHRHHHRRHRRRHHRHRRRLRHSHLGMIMSRCLHRTLRCSSQMILFDVFQRTPIFPQSCLSMLCTLHPRLYTMYHDFTQTVA